MIVQNIRQGLLERVTRLPVQHASAPCWISVGGCQVEFTPSGWVDLYRYRFAGESDKFVQQRSYFHGLARTYVQDGASWDFLRPLNRARIGVGDIAYVQKIPFSPQIPHPQDGFLPLVLDPGNLGCEIRYDKFFRLAGSGVVVEPQPHDAEPAHGQRAKRDIRRRLGRCVVIDRSNRTVFGVSSIAVTVNLTRACKYE